MQTTPQRFSCRTKALAGLIGMMLFAAAPAGRAQDIGAPSTTQRADVPAASLISKGLDEGTAGITLTTNQSRLVVTAVPVKAIDLTQPDVVLAKVISPTNVILTARKPGVSQLVIFDDSGRSQTIEITVSADISSLDAAIKKVLPKARVEVSAQGGSVVVRGQVPDAEVADQVMQLAAPYAAKVVNLLEISGGRQVNLQVRFAEVSRDAVSALGVNFGVSGSGGFGASVIGGVNQFGIASGATAGSTVLSVPSPGSNVTGFGSFQIGKTPFDIFVTALRENNLLRVLAEPNLTVMSGSQASFLAGGEFPYPVPQSGGAGGGSTTITIQFKQYGIQLVFTPVVLGDGRIRLHVQPEVSDLDYTHSITLQGFSIPGITTRTADTVVELNEGETLSLAGLLNTRVNATNNSTPLLGDLPVIGALFRSVRYERNETELVVLVTPTLGAGMKPGQVPQLPGEHWRYPREGQLFLNADLGGPANDTSHAPSQTMPREFHGAYGFVPASATVAGSK